MNIDIHPKDDNISWQELVDLFHESFQERLDQGLHFTCSYFTAEELERRGANNTVLVAIDQDNHQLVGTAFIEIMHDKKKKWGYLTNMAIRPDCKRYGIGSKLEQQRMAIAQANDCDYVISDTAVGATSSVKWHLKNGFKKVKMTSFDATNYYSYIFRKQLKPHPLWSSDWYCRMRLFLSSITCRLKFHKNGNYTALMKLYVKIFDFFMPTEDSNH